MKHITISYITSIIFVLIFVENFQVMANESFFPTVKQFEKKIHLVDNKTTELKTKIFGTDEIPIYLLECYLNAYSHEDKDFDYSGDFECRLTSLYSKDSYSTLLTEVNNQTRDWQSRGRFFVEDLIGSCGIYPEYGKIRNFRLRNMNLTIEVGDLNIDTGSSAKNQPFNRDRVKDLFLTVKVASDMSATSEIAEPPKYLEPPNLHPEDVILSCIQRNTIEDPRPAT